MPGAIDRNQLVVDHLDLIGHIVGQVSSRFPRHVDRGELWNAGALGLVEASRRYDPAAGTPFNRYASIRIRGAIIDSTRTRDWATRSLRRSLREITRHESDFEERNGRRPEDHELASQLGVGADRLAQIRSSAVTSTLLHLDLQVEGEPSLREHIEEPTPDFLPHENIEHRELLGTLVTALDGLPPTQAEVVRRYYLEGDLLQDIAGDMNVTEARVSQIRSEALTSMRAFFGSIYEGVEEVSPQASGMRSRSAYLAQLAERSTWRTRLEAAEKAEVADFPASARL